MTSANPHFNIFHAYRGPARSEDAALRQLEDNLARALAITLDAVRDTPLRLPLLEALQIKRSSALEPYRVRLQVSNPPLDLTEAACRRLLVIHGGPRLETVDVASDAVTGRADAVIATRRSLLAIESKLGNRVEKPQLDRHRETFGIREDDVVAITWSDLARSLRSLPVNRRAHPVARFVLAQFEEYLRMNGFGGLTHEHFAYFALPAQQRDALVKEGIRRVLAEMLDELD